MDTQTDPYTGRTMENRQQPSPFPDSEGRPTQQQNPPVEELLKDDRTDFERSNDLSREQDSKEHKAKAKADKKLQEQKSKIILVKDVNKELFDNTTEESDALYPFYQLEIGQGFFVPVSDQASQSQLLRQFHSQLAYIRQDTAEFERDANGDEVWETVTVKTRPRDKDGTVKQQSDGTDIVGADHVLRPVLINPRRFIVKPVSEGYDIGEGHEVEDDGVMVIRVA